MNLSELSKKALGLPLLPGVYIMRDKSGKIIYIGKAKALKNRVSQYFRNVDKHAEKVKQMVLHVEDFDYILCDNEFEALILECSLIKQHMPKYNILLKDDKGYHYIKISDDTYPKISAVKIQTADGKYMGPYNSSFTVTESVDEAHKIFRLPSCNLVFTGKKLRQRPCLNYFIGQCSAPCSGKIHRQEYLESVRQAIDFLKKGSAETVERLKGEMEQAAESLEFEKAAKIRDRLNAINRLSQKQKVVSSSVEHQDIIAVFEGAKYACFEVFRFKGGRLYDREHFFFDRSDNLPEIRGEFITRYYSLGREIPPRISVDGSVEGEPLLEEWLSKTSGRKVVLSHPKKGDGVRLVEMCRSNAAQRIAEKEGKRLKETAVLDELARLTGLKELPEYIESYDISHTAGVDNVGGMIVFENARPKKSAYRRFIIKDFSGQDDYAAMAEVLRRRMKRYQEGDPAFSRLPDLILLDGGAGQVSAVRQVFESVGVAVPLFGMVKDGHHKTRALIGESGEIEIKAIRSVFTLISSIQDEVHRFAIAFHHERSKKRAFSSQLLEIEGIGESKAKTLLKAFKSLRAISECSVEDLVKIKGISVTNAENIFTFFHQSDL